MTPEERTQRRLERKAAQENARRTEAAPLLAAAGLVALTTPAEMAARKVRLHAAAAEAFFWREVKDAERSAQADAVRAEVAQVVADLQPLDALCTRSFGSRGMGSYRCYFWQQVRDRAYAGLAPVEPILQWTEEERAASQARVARLVQVMDRVREDHPALMARCRRQERAAWRELNRLTEQALACSKEAR